MKEAQPTQQFVDIEEIKDGVLVLKNGGLRKVLMVSGINFELKSEEEQNVIAYAYQNFLNALDFSVQIVIHSRKMNVDGYLEKLRERQDLETNELLKNQISEYLEFVKSFVETNAVMAKTFFVVVPYDPIVIPGGGKKLLGLFGIGAKKKTAPLEQTSEQKTAQINQRTEEVINGLSQIGLRVVALNDEELIELFYNLYNPSAVERKELKIAHGQD
jgi:type IV secretory pathway VirB4 component